MVQEKNLTSEGLSLAGQPHRRVETNQPAFFSRSVRRAAGNPEGLAEAHVIGKPIQLQSSGQRVEKWHLMHTKSDGSLNDCVHCESEVMNCESCFRCAGTSEKEMTGDIPVIYLC
jgi:hypothetical protein